MGSMYSHVFHGDVTPFVFQESAFDPMFGFEKTGRKLRTPSATDADMACSKIPIEARDYCAKETLEYQRCKHFHFPFYDKCNHEMHTLEHCQFADYTLRMKEYERERRLMERAKRVGPERAGYRVMPAQS